MPPPKKKKKRRKNWGYPAGIILKMGFLLGLSRFGVVVPSESAVR